MTYRKLSEERPTLGQICLLHYDDEVYPSVAVSVKNQDGFLWHLPDVGDNISADDNDYWMPCPVRGE